MDSQLKQRLVGAAVLVSLAILVVPILLDGGYRPAPSPRRDIAPMPADSFEETVPPLAQGVQESLDAGLEAGPDALSNAASEAAAALDVPPEVAPPAFTAEEAVGMQPPEDGVGIGHRRLGAAEPIAGWARIGTGRAGAYLEQPHRIDPGDTSSTSADL